MTELGEGVLLFCHFFFQSEPLDDYKESEFGITPTNSNAAFILHPSLQIIAHHHEMANEDQQVVSA